MSSEKHHAHALDYLVRALSFDGRSEEPYLIGHADRAQLNGEVIKKRFQEYASEIGNPAIEDPEDFEEFLAWLDDRYGYFALLIADKMLEL